MKRDIEWVRQQNHPQIASFNSKEYRQGLAWALAERRGEMATQSKPSPAVSVGSSIGAMDGDDDEDQYEYEIQKCGGKGQTIRVRTKKQRDCDM